MLSSFPRILLVFVVTIIIRSISSYYYCTGYCRDIREFHNGQKYLMCVFGLVDEVLLNSQSNGYGVDDVGLKGSYYDVLLNKRQ